MSDPRLNRVLHKQVQDLSRCNTPNAPVRFRLKKSPFDDDDEDECDTKEEASAVDKTHKLTGCLHKTYPLEPPEVRFLTPIYHPNVGVDGKFCHEVLKKTVEWKSNTTLIDVVKAIVDRIDKPDVDQTITFEVGKEYAEEPAEFKRKACFLLKSGIKGETTEKKCRLVPTLFHWLKKSSNPFALRFTSQAATAAMLFFREGSNNESFFLLFLQLSGFYILLFHINVSDEKKM
ncbi:unnamed protein product [Adineta ricciae]|uniref:UBC core domain-containing protein n=1 Tax=Adineta ricciae TaxID=249248 RepID=A0A814KE03_ADIRI|nr:unnamed protein product [Adineta ricciae]